MNIGASKLKVQRLLNDDHWKDMARIPWKHRKDVNGEHINPIKVCKVTVGDKHKLLSIRGWNETEEPVILLDRATMEVLKVEIDKEYDVEIKQVGIVGYWLWASRSTDPAYRVPAQVNLISLGVGFAGLILALVALFKQ